MPDSRHDNSLHDSAVGSHGPGFAVAVLEKYPDLRAPEYKEMRGFVGSWGV